MLGLLLYIQACSGSVMMSPFFTDNSDLIP